MGSNGGSQSGDVFDVRRVRRLVELMHEFELAEIDLRQGEQRICLRKDQEPAPLSAPAIAGPQFSGAYGGPPFAPPLHASHVEQSSASSSTPQPESSSARYVVSPMVGTFYSAANPDAPPFVKVGDQVGPESIVCIIEAMKVFNEIPAECSGKVTAVLVENGDAVEYGQKLFRSNNSRTSVRCHVPTHSVANRGEIALRIIRACRELGIETVAIFSEADRGADYLELADEAYLRRPRPTQRQLSADRQRDQRGGGRQRPGDSSGLRISGRERPFQRSLPQLQDRLHRPVARGDGPAGRQERRPRTGPRGERAGRARQRRPDRERRTRRCRFAHEIGFPVLIKAVAGGGGRGMRVAANDLALKSALQQAQAEAEAAFGNGAVYLEKYIEQPRHVEVQVLADHHGNAVHLWERDCSRAAAPSEADRRKPRSQHLAEKRARRCARRRGG